MVRGERVAPPYTICGESVVRVIGPVMTPRPHLSQVSGGELRSLFCAIDLDENGAVSLADFRKFLGE